MATPNENMDASNSSNTSESKEIPAKAAKRPASPEKETANAKKARPLDVAVDLGLQPGDRLEVQWELQDEPYWWPATLLDYDGHTEDGVAVRILDYDPHPSGGFPERSQESVVFLPTQRLVDVETQDILDFRRVGEEEPVFLSNDAMEALVNDTLAGALAKNKAAWNTLDTARQAVIGDLIAKKKEKLLALMEDHMKEQPGSVITSTVMQEILQRTME